MDKSSKYPMQNWAIARVLSSGAHPTVVLPQDLCNGRIAAEGVLHIQERSPQTVGFIANLCNWGFVENISTLGAVDSWFVPGH